MKKTSLSALAAAGLLVGGLSVTSASAADLGGNCCADLEERIAELEATTARKGNRKVSLTVSGWVGQQVMFWDDGYETNQYVGDLGRTLSSHVKFTGQATIAPGWSAGYVLHIEAYNNQSLALNQDYQGGPGAGDWAGFDALQSYWFIRSENLGKISVGRQSQASDNTAILVDGSGSLVPANWVAFDMNSFAIRISGAPGMMDYRTWGNIGGCTGGGAWGDCNGLTQNVVRYDTPTFGGFSASASWGEDDMWDVALRYAGEFGGFKFAAAAAYNEITGGGQPNTIVGGFGPAIGGITAFGEPPKTEYFQVGAYLQHVPTGLFVYGAYGNNELSLYGDSYESDTYYVKAGLRQRWTPLGHTVLYGEYLNVDESSSDGFNGDLDVWGLGIVQEIDNAAMSLWVSYRHLSYDDNVLSANGFSAEDFQYVKAGALINF